MDKAAERRAHARAAAADTARRTLLRRAAMFSSPGVARDVFPSLRPFACGGGGGLRASLSFAAPGGAGWGAPLVAELLDLTRLNMRAVYEAAPGWGGWRDGKKRGELLDADSRFLVAREEGGGALLGFASFRFLAEGERDVLYLYELQLAEAAQRKGLGRHLMLLCEQAAADAGMQACVLAWLPARGAPRSAPPHTHIRAHTYRFLPFPHFPPQRGADRAEKQRVRAAVLQADGLRA